MYVHLLELSTSKHVTTAGLAFTVKAKSDNVTFPENQMAL